MVEAARSTPVSSMFAEIALELVLLLAAAAFLAGFIDSIAGGGGLITVMGSRGGPGSNRPPGADVWDVEGWEDPPAPPDRPGAGL